MRIRTEHKLNEKYVMSMLEGPGEEEFREAVASLWAVQGKQLSDYCYGIVMPEGDRSLQVPCPSGWMGVSGWMWLDGCAWLNGWVSGCGHARMCG